MESLFTLDLPAALAWQNLGLCLLGMAAGTLIGTFLGTLPTFVAASVMLVGLPLSGSTAAAILAGVFCGALYGTSLSVVLAGAPARPPDGPAAEKPAQARPGAGALLVASLLGSTVATLVALLLGCAVLLVFVAVPGNLMTAIALAMGNPEFVALIAVFLVLVVALGNRSREPLEALRGWMARNNAVIMAVILVLIGAKLIGDAIAGFSS